MTKSECGALGGTAAFNKYGSDEMVCRGRLGGRPRALTLSEIKQQKTQAAENILNEVLGDKRNYKRANKRERLPLC